jgi:hypothetical protein
MLQRRNKQTYAMKPFLRPVLAAIAFAPFAALGQAPTIEQRLAACAAKPDNGEKLACFNEVTASVASPTPAEPRAPEKESAAESGPAPATAASPTPQVRPVSAATPAPADPAPTDIMRDAQGRMILSGQWVISRETDSMTDRPRVHLFNEGDMEVGRTNGGVPAIVVRCFQSRLEVIANVQAFVGSRDALATRIRFGSAEPISQRWTTSTSGTAVFSQDPAGFMNRLVRAERILIEVTAFGGERYRMAFDNKGLEAALPEIAACWRPPQTQQPRPASAPASRPQQPSQPRP